MSTLYKVQVGAYLSKSNAQKMKAAVEAAVRSRRKSGKLKEDISVACVKDGLFWKVQCGAFANGANAKKRLEQVRAAGFPNAKIMKAAVASAVPASSAGTNASSGTGSSVEPGSTSTAPEPVGFQKVLGCMGKYLDSKTARKDIVADFNEYAKAVGGIRLRTDKDSLCSETVISCFWRAGYIDLIGRGSTGCSSLKSNAKKLGTWHSGSTGIKAGDIVLYGSGTPNHTELAIDGTYNISGQYRDGGVHRRVRAGRTIHGYIRPKYPAESSGTPTVQEAVDNQETVDNQNPAVPHRIRIAALAFFDTGSESSQYGDCTALIEYGDDDKTVEHAVLIDTAMDKSSANVIRKLKALGVRKLDAIIISHAHGDHYGGTSAMVREFGVKDIYVPDPAEVDKYQKTYGNALRSQYKKAAGHYVKAGTEFSIGNMHFRCVYQCPAASLKEHDSHHFINNESVVLRVTLNGWVYHSAGDLQNEGNNLLVKSLKDLKADIMKCQWHGDANACNETICRAVRPRVAFSNYHHAERSGRGTTRKRLEAVGAVVARNHENGDVYIDCLPGTMKLSCSKGNLSRTFRK